MGAPHQHVVVRVIVRRLMRPERSSTIRATTLALLTLAACAEPHTGIIAQSELVSLQLSGPRDDRIIRLDPAPGARINARLPPVLELRDGSLITLSSDELTADSGYFVASPRAALRREHARTGTLRASVCPADVRVCLSVVLPVALPE